MAILYGTTADGDSLPVEVNEFGQLIAQGLQGQEGPPGPPGIGQLPPDPFEGAVLGWKDNTLAWLGGSVPVPTGVFGPILSYENGALLLEDEPDYPYLTEIYLSDSQGDVLTWAAVSPPISSINNVPNTSNLNLTLENSQGLSDFSIDDVVQGPSDALVGDWSSTSNMENAVNAFDGDDTSTFAGCKGGSFYNTITTTPFSATVIEIKANAVIGVTDIKVNGGNGYTPIKDGNDPGWFKVTLPQETIVNSLTMAWNQGSSGSISFFVFGVKADGKLLVDAGSPAFVKVVAIDEAVPYLRVSGGTWSQGERVFGPQKSGSGSVQTCIANSIVLRADNKQWKVGSYVSNIEQKLAARYVYTDEIKKKLL